MFTNCKTHIPYILSSSPSDIRNIRNCSEMTQEQINQIVDSINAMLDRARPAILSIEDICDPGYYRGRAKYPITAIVYTAFNVEEQNIPGFHIQKVLYGGKKKMYLPELISDEMMIKVFSDGSNPCSTDEVKKKLRLLGTRLHLLIFSVDKEEYILSKLQLLSLDGFTNKGNARVTKRETLYELA